MKNSTDSVIRTLIVIYAIFAGIVNWFGWSYLFIIIYPEAMMRFQIRSGLSYTILGMCIRLIVGIPMIILVTPLLFIVPLSVGLGLLHEYRAWKQRKDTSIMADRIARKG
ncbi:MAG: hypothetical protein JRE23_16995 [Deltaproteobacteria bacterium]|nr:hypothetical protein [Deltaproteobacteria bacterium]